MPQFVSNGRGITQINLKWLAIVVGVVVVLAGSIAYLPGKQGVVGYCIVMVLGAAVGSVELLGRYLYAPLRAVLTGSGAAYVAVNVIAAAAAYYMLGPSGFDLFPVEPPKPVNELYRVLTASFSALVFMRSSLFKVRLGDNEVGIGPAAVLDTLLMIADRGVDRQEAVLRAQEVTNLLKGADPIRGAKLLAAYCLALMQNVTAEEQKRIEDVVNKIASDPNIDKAISLDLIALQLSNIVGPNVLQAAVEALGERLNPSRGPVPPPPPPQGPIPAAPMPPPPVSPAPAPAAASSPTPSNQSATAPQGQPPLPQADPSEPSSAPMPSSAGTFTPSPERLRAEIESAKQAASDDPNKPTK